jgi:magnesium transporter
MPATLARPGADAAPDATQLAQMRAADVADALNRMPPEQAAATLPRLPFRHAVSVLDQPHMERRGAIFTRMDTPYAAALIEAMSADEQAALFRELDEPDRARLMAPLKERTKEAIERLLRYPETTAGGIMTTEFVAVPATCTVAEVLEHVREVHAEKETVYAIYLTDQDGSLQQVISLRDVLGAEPTTLAADVTDRRAPLSVTVDTPREDAARIISRYNLLAVPVVDDERRVVGIVTVDDVIDAMVDELTRDVQKFGGMEALEGPYMQMGLLPMIRKRAGWLSVLFLSEMLTATAMGHFEGEIDKAVVLALFVPLIISSGGNSGSQATSLIIRSMALGEVKLRDWWRVAARELPSGLALGGILGVLGLLRILVWQYLGWYDYGTHYPLVAATVACALVGVVTFGSLAGSLLPFILRRLGFDPASASAPFVATLVDVTGLVIYFSVAYAILRGTLL